MMKRKVIFISFSFLFFFNVISFAATINVNRIKEAYPQMIQNATSHYIVWSDGTRTPIKGAGWIGHLASLLRNNKDSFSLKELQCHGFEPFLKKMYGKTEYDVEKNLVTVFWMPHVFGYIYPLKVTTINGIDKKIQHISDELEKLPTSDFKYLAQPAGSFYWRKVKHENYLSAHSFGIAMDINSHYGNYWMWDWEKENRPRTNLVLQNHIPMRIVKIFEDEGFIWGGRWYFYDTMHFEYRPELFVKSAQGLQYNRALDMHCYG